MNDIDVSVSELPQAQTFDGSSLLAVENQGQAQKVTGKQIQDFAAQPIANLTVLAQQLLPGASATVEKQLVNGIYRFVFGLPAGPVGPEGPAGPVGPVGPAGPQGIQGPVGPQGEPGQSFHIADYYDTLEQLEAAIPAPHEGDAYGVGFSEPYLIYIYSPRLGWVNNGTIQGPVGPAGPVGPQGPAGATGPAGPQGPAGATGPAGPQGPAGATGPEGPQGPAGADGKNGTDGEDGLSVYLYNSDETFNVGGAYSLNMDLLNLQGRTPQVGELVLSTSGYYLRIWETSYPLRCICVLSTEGPRGATGSMGPKPVKGQDYWTDTDKQEIVNDVLGSLSRAEEVSV